jgi:hypothetical protein
MRKTRIVVDESHSAVIVRRKMENGGADGRSKWKIVDGWRITSRVVACKTSVESRSRKKKRSDTGNQILSRVGASRKKKPRSDAGRLSFVAVSKRKQRDDAKRRLPSYDVKATMTPKFSTVLPSLRSANSTNAKRQTNAVCERKLRLPSANVRLSKNAVD